MIKFTIKEPVLQEKLLIPEPSKKRLIRLARLLSCISEKTLTSVRIQELTGCLSATVRKDISYVLSAKSGTEKVFSLRGASRGYKREELLSAINLALKLEVPHEEKKYCIIGLGALGQALLENTAPKNLGFLLAAGFDASTNRTETINAPCPLYPLSRLEALIQEKKIEYALLTVEDKLAQETANRIVLCGIRGIINYTAAVLSVPKTTRLKDVSVTTALQDLIW